MLQNDIRTLKTFVCNGQHITTVLWNFYTRVLRHSYYSHEHDKQSLSSRVDQNAILKFIKLFNKESRLEIGKHTISLVIPCMCD